MFKNRKITIIAGVFIALLAIVVINKLVENKKGDRTFKSYIVNVDTAKVDYIQITPKSKVGEVVLKKDNGWKVLFEDRLVSADDAVITEMLTQLVNLKPSRIAATKKDKWTEYEVTDSLASSRVILKSKGNVIADLYIGKFDFKQQPQQGMNQYQQQQQRPDISTFVRNVDEKEVFVVKEFLSMTFNRERNSFRNKTVVKSNGNNWSKLSFNYPADSSFHLMKQNGSWMVSGMMVDSIKVENYILSLKSKTSSNFVDNINKTQLTNPIFTVSIEGDNTPQILLNAYPADSTNQYYVTSSMNADAIFSGAQANLFQDIFAGQKRFELEEEQVTINVND